MIGLNLTYHRICLHAEVGHGENELLVLVERLQVVGLLLSLLARHRGACESETEIEDRFWRSVLLVDAGTLQALQLEALSLLRQERERVFGMWE